MADEQGRREVFVSHARGDDDDHTDAIRVLCRLLAQHPDVGPIWDGPAANVPEWTEWIDEHMDRSDFILVVLSQAYKDYAEKRGPQGKGRGVQYEVRRMRSLNYYQNSSGDKREIVIVILPGHTEEEIPTFLKLGAPNFVQLEELTPEGVKPLLRRILDRPYEAPAPRGTAQILLTRAEEEAAAAAAHSEERLDETGIAREFTRALHTFEGRTRALQNITSWLRDDDDGSSRIVVSGPGSGKTALLGLVAHLAGGYAERVGVDLPDDCRPPENSIKVALYVRNMPPDKILARISQAAGISPSDVARYISSASLEDGRNHLINHLLSNDIRLTVLLDAYDEISPSSSGGQSAGKAVDDFGTTVIKYLMERRSAPIRLLIGSRKRSLENLGVDLSDENKVINLDKEYKDPAALQRWVRAILTGDEGDDRAESPSVWAHASDDLVDAAVRVICGIAEESFYLGEEIAKGQAQIPELPDDPHSAEWVAQLPKAAGQAMKRELERRLRVDGSPEATRRAVQRAVDLLLPLSYGRGDGIPWAAAWLPLANALRSPDTDPYEDADLQWICDHASSYVVQSDTPTPGRTLYRLYHETLAAFLRAGEVGSGHERDEGTDEGLIAHRLLRGVHRLSGGTRDWGRASTYVRCHLLEHAIASNDTALIDALVFDPWFLANGGQAELRSSLDSLTVVQHQAVAEAYRSALACLRFSTAEDGFTSNILSSESRRLFLGQLTLAARCRGTDVLAGKIALGDAPHQAPWRADWAAWHQQPPHVQLTGFKDHVWAAAAGTLNTGQSVVVTAGDDGELRVWDILSGTLERRFTRAHAGRILGLATGRLDDGRSFVVSAGDDGQAQTWDLNSGGKLGPAFSRHGSPIHGVTLSNFGATTAVITGDDEGSIEIWNPLTGQQLRGTYRPVESPITALETLVLNDELHLISAHVNGDLYVYRPVRPGAQEARYHPSGRAIRALAVGAIEDRQVLVSAGEDDEIRVWDPHGHIELPEVPRILVRHTDRLLALTVANVSGHSAAIAAGEDGIVRIWDITDGAPIGAPFTGHTKTVRAIAVAQPGNRTIVVSAGDDTTPMAWDLTPTGMANEPFTGHRHRVRSLMYTSLDGRQTLISGSSDSTVRQWDPDTGVQTARPFERHRQWVRALAAANVSGRQCVVSGGADTTVRIWDATSGEEIGTPLLHSAGVTAAVVVPAAASTLLVSACLDGSVLTRDLSTAQEIASYTGHQDADAGRRAVWVLSQLQLEADESGSVVLSAGGDGNLHLWRAATGQVIARPPSGHRVVTALTAIPEWGIGYVVTGGDDGAVRVHRLEPHEDWLVASSSSAPEQTNHQVEALVAASVSADAAVLVSAHSNGDLRFTKVAKTADGVSAEKSLVYAGAHRGRARALAVGYAGGRPAIFSGGDDYLIRAWDVERRAPLRTLHRGWVRSLIVAPWTTGWLGSEALTEDQDKRSEQRTLRDEWIVVSGGDDDTIRMRPLGWGQARQHERVVLAHHRGVRALAISETDPPHLVSGGVDGRLKVWSPSSGHPPHVFSGHGDWVRALATGAARPGLTVAVSASGDGSVGVWDLTDLVAFTSPRAIHAAGVRAIDIAWLPSTETGQTRSVIVSGGADGRVAVTDLRTGSAVAEHFDGHRAGVRALATTSLAGTPVVISGDEDGAVLAWNLATQSSVGQVPHQTGEINAITAQERGSPQEPGCTWVAVAAGDTVTLSSWTRAGSWRERAVARFGCPVLALAMPAESLVNEPPGHVVVAATQGIAVLDFSGPPIKELPESY